MFKLNSICVAISCILVSSSSFSQSFSNVVDAASKWVNASATEVKGTMDSMSTKNVQKESSAPINIIRRNEAWGDSPSAKERDPMPFRGRPEQFADERRLDDRYLDKNQPYRVKPAKVVVEPQRVSASRKTIRVTAYPRNTEQSGTAPASLSQDVPNNSICGNLSTLWSSAAYLSQQGTGDKALSAYVKAIRSCAGDKEVTATAWQAVKHLNVPELEAFRANEVFSQGGYVEARYAIDSSLVYQYNKQSNDIKIAAQAETLKQEATDRKDENILGVLGWAHQRSAKYKEAEFLFRSALKINASNESAREGLVYALLAQNKTIQAGPEIDKLVGDSQVSARGMLYVAQARSAYKDKEFDKTLLLLSDADKYGVVQDNSLLALKAWALRATGNAQNAADIFKELNAAEPLNLEYASGYAESVISTKDAELIRRVYDNPPHGQQDRMRQAYAAIMDTQGRSEQANAILGKKTEQTRAYLFAGILAKSKSGDPGKDKLSMTVAPEVAAGTTLPGGAKLDVSSAKVTLDDGQIVVKGTESRLSYTENINSDSRVKLGVGASVVGTNTRLTLDSNYRQYVNSGFVEGGLTIEPVTDTARSYAGKQVLAGTKPLLSGQAMNSKMNIGGVNAISDAYKLTWAGALGSISGKNFSSTTYFDTRAALTKDFNIPRFSWAAVGPEVRLAQYSSDQNRWEAGYGGFYSPLSEMGAGLRYSLMTAEGQRSLFKATGFAGLVKKEFYGGVTSGGALVEMDAVGSFLLGKYLIAKGGLNLKTSTGYTDLSAFAGLELSFEPRSRLFSSDLLSGSKSVK